MKIINTFVPGLKTVVSESSTSNGEHIIEFDELFNSFQDPEYIMNFLRAYEDMLDIDLVHATQIIYDDARKLRKKINSLGNKSPSELFLLFKNLDNNDSKSALSNQKARQNWLRIYAYKIDKSNFIVTGGAIKLDFQHKMKDWEHLNKELTKAKQLESFLKEEGIVDEDGLLELMEIQF